MLHFNKNSEDTDNNGVKSWEGDENGEEWGHWGEKKDNSVVKVWGGGWREGQSEKRGHL